MYLWGKDIVTMDFLVLNVANEMNGHASSSGYLLDSIDLWRVRLGYVSLS